MGGLACKAKAILNSGAVSDGARGLGYVIEETEYAELTDEQWKAVIRHLNDAENSVNSAKRAFLERLGFDGPWPNAMK